MARQIFLLSYGQIVNEEGQFDRSTVLVNSQNVLLLSSFFMALCLLVFNKIKQIK